MGRDVCAPSTLLPPGIERMGVEVARDMREGLNGADIRFDFKPTGLHFRMEAPLVEHRTVPHY